MTLEEAAEAYRAAAEHVRTLEAVAKDLRERREEALVALQEAHATHDRARHQFNLVASAGPVPWRGRDGGGNSELGR